MTLENEPAILNGETKVRGMESGGVAVLNRVVRKGFTWGGGI